MDCVFCRIIAGNLPALKVYEDERTLVIMDIARDVDGHMLVIPKKHAQSLLDCDPDTLAALMATAQKVARHCVNRCGYDGVNLLNASGESAGQSVAHLHLHLIPRQKGDGIDAWPPFEGARTSIQETHQRIRMT